MYANVIELEGSVDADEALTYLGYTGQTLDQNLQETLASTKADVEALSIQGIAQAFPIESQSSSMVKLGSCNLELKGHDIAAHLNGAHEAVLMLVTLGFDSERLIRRERAISNTRGLLADACASAYVESGANSLSDLISDNAHSKDLIAGSRFSPGYGDLSLGVQEPILDILNAKKLLGISITESSLLIPMKTITAIVGLFPAKASHPQAIAARVSQDTYARSNDASQTQSTLQCMVCKLRDTCSLRAQGRICNGCNEHN